MLFILSDLNVYLLAANRKTNLFFAADDYYRCVKLNYPEFSLVLTGNSVKQVMMLQFVNHVISNMHRYAAKDVATMCCDIVYGLARTLCVAKI